VPRGPVRRIRREGARRDLADDIGTTAGEPVGVGEGDERGGVLRFALDDAFVDGASDLVEVTVRLDGGDEGGGVRRLRADGVEPREELRDVGVGVIIADDRGDGRAGIRGHPEK